MCSAVTLILWMQKQHWNTKKKKLFFEKLIHVKLSILTQLVTGTGDEAWEDFEES